MARERYHYVLRSKRRESDGSNDSEDVGYGTRYGRDQDGNSVELFLMSEADVAARPDWGVTQSERSLN